MSPLETPLEVKYACAECHQNLWTSWNREQPELTCAACGAKTRVAGDAFEGNRMVRCLVCPNRELFVRKDFPQTLGVAIVIVGIVLSSIAWGYRHIGWTFGILFATALADLVLYFLVGDSLMCYRCGAQCRGLADLSGHAGFELATHEKHRQMAARVG